VGVVISIQVYLVDLDTERQVAHLSVDVRGTVVALPLLKSDMAKLAGREGELFALQLDVPAKTAEVGT
jgi:hypothetical protein